MGSLIKLQEEEVEEYKRLLENLFQKHNDVLKDLMVLVKEQEKTEERLKSLERLLKKQAKAKKRFENKMIEKDDYRKEKDLTVESKKLEDLRIREGSIKKEEMQICSVEDSMFSDDEEDEEDEKR